GGGGGSGCARENASGGLQCVAEGPVNASRRFAAHRDSSLRPVVLLPTVVLTNFTLSSKAPGTNAMRGLCANISACGGRHETSPPTISSSGRQCRRAAGGLAHCLGANLPVAADHDDRALRGGGRE